MADEIMGTATDTATATATAKRKPAKRKPPVDINAPTPGYDGPTGNRYVLVTEPKTVKDNGQIGPIVAAMKSAGRKGFTATEIAVAVAGKFNTVQTPLRVVRYYVSEWRKRKLIRAV